MKHKIAIIAFLLLLVGQSTPAQQEIVLDNVTNSIGDSLLIAGNTHVLSLRVRSLPAPPCYDVGYNLNNGFALTSPDGATWNGTLGSVTDVFIESHNWFTVGVNHFEDPLPGGDNGAPDNDGNSPDYLVFFAAVLLKSAAMQPGYDEVSYLIEISTDLADSNLTICLDQSSLGRLNTWLWWALNRHECNVAPDLSGPFCFTIVAPTCGDANTDGQVSDNDLSFLIQYYFGFGECPARGTGDVNGDGTIDISDIIYLANYLHNGGPAPCAGTGPGGLDWKDKPDQRQTGNE